MPAQAPGASTSPPASLFGTTVLNRGRDNEKNSSINKARRTVKKVLSVPEDAPETVHSFDYLRGNTGNLKDNVLAYVKSLFPFIQWVPRYNLQWLIGDLIAGITVGIVLVPQALSYAKLASLPAEYGLYSSFIGVLTYAFFATSKDVSIGPVAVMSLQTANVIAHVQKTHPGVWDNQTIATGLAFICGFIVLGIGLLRLGWIVEFIPQPAVSGFMTGSAINIAAGQVPALFGIAKRLNTREATYKVIINTLKNLKYAKLDAALGVTALFTLYLIKWSMAYAGNRYPKFRRASFFITCFRHAFVILVWTIIAWRMVAGKKPAKYPISVLGTVPRGLRDVGPPTITAELLGALGPQLPVSTIVLLLEHISIAKSFGRLNGYKINPNQELIAIGVNNTLGTLFRAYPSTGSFSRSALKSKAGVRTPAAGIPTGIVVIIALYALTSAFYYIPNAAISALIIHAVADLVASPAQSYGFWRVAPLEYIIWLAAVLVSIFSSIENGIYTSLAASVVLLLFRIARPRGHFLGRVRIRPENDSDEKHTRDVYVPLCGDGGITNPQVKIEAPPPGVIIYRFEESFLYPNASFINQAILDQVKAKTRRGRDMTFVKVGERPWNDPGPRKGQAIEDPNKANQPICRAVILDFAAVANLDTTGVQNLIDLRRAVENYADQTVEFHFSAVLSPWTRRALIAGGFGFGTPRHALPAEVAPALPPMDILSPADRARQETEALESNAYGSGAQTQQSRQTKFEHAEESAFTDQEAGKRSLAESETSTETPLLSTTTPFFHFDLASAIGAVAPGE
ncbi:hypothetical protein QFC22_003037 [Naganishia vaughanmartiniae]|uniref:Uncharacterized protein n=1 Tax=Naganishia vaughanmartiniae TaxID=1424756 RepID=A0ACC2X945_9TREE|nr:hypothetical protein QFC22_003037 [Naganishia vaughanmartiniae]